MARFGDFAGSLVRTLKQVKVVYPEAKFDLNPGGPKL
jgi:hypothetical protein